MVIMKTLYDVQQLLKQFNVFVYVGKREWDIELMSIELKNLYQAGVVEKPTYIKAQLVLKHEHHIEELRNKEEK
jgi:uncharacterized protein YqgQ